MGNSVTIDANRQELWSKDLLADVERDVKNIFRFMGEGANNTIQVSNELKKKKGDQENFSLIARLAGDGVTGDAELEGNEEAMLSYNEIVSIDQIRNAVRLTGKLDNQKVVYDQISSARENLRIWLREFKARNYLLKLGGVTNTTLVDTNGVTVGGRAAWSNTPAFIPDADTAAGTGARYKGANSSGAASLTATDILTLDMVTEAATQASLTDPKIQKITMGADDFYVMYVHPYQARDLKKSSDWKTAQQDARARGDSNPVFRGALGFWSNVLLLENEYVPWLDVSAAGNSFRGAATGTDFAVDSARALLCGRQALIVANASNPEALVVEQFDYKNKDGVAVSWIGGNQKTMFNNSSGTAQEFGVLAVDTAAAA